MSGTPLQPILQHLQTDKRHLVQLRGYCRGTLVYLRVQSSQRVVSLASFLLLIQGGASGLDDVMSETSWLVSDVQRLSRAAAVVSVVGGVARELIEPIAVAVLILSAVKECRHGFPQGFDSLCGGVACGTGRGGDGGRG